MRHPAPSRSARPLKRNPIRPAAALMLSCAVSAAMAQPPFPAGPETRVNGATDGIRFHPQVASAGGAFVVVWSRDSNVLAQRFDSLGLPVGGELQVNDLSTLAPLQEPDVAMAPSGDFVVAWSASPLGAMGVQTYYHDQFSRRFTADGTASAETLISEDVLGNTQGAQRETAILPSPDGDFAVVWEDRSYVVYSEHLYGRRLAPSGSPDGNRFTVAPASVAGYEHLHPAMAAGGDEFLLVWARNRLFSDPDQWTISARLGTFNSPTLDPIDFEAPQHVSQLDDWTHGEPAVTALSDGFLVLWDRQETSEIGSTYQLVARKVGTDGVPVGTEQIVRTSSSAPSGAPRLASDSQDHVLAVWSDAERDLSGDAVIVRYLDPSGAPLAAELQVNQYTRSDQTDPDVAAVGDGDFLITWSSPQVENRSQIYMRRYHFTAPIFADGFEGGDTTAWSSAVP